jgi:hypothetical protein
MVTVKATRTVRTRTHYPRLLSRRSSHETPAPIVVVGHARGGADVLPPSKVQDVPAQDALYVDRLVDGREVLEAVPRSLHRETVRYALVRLAPPYTDDIIMTPLGGGAQYPDLTFSL